MDIQWYPGHMTKAKRQMQEDIKLIDLVIELVDARIPYSSRNPEIDDLAKNKSRMVLLNKSDLADPSLTRQWMDYYKSKGIYALALDSRQKSQMKAVLSTIEEACKEKRERDLKRGIKNRPVRAMIVGIPNVGKSTFINSLVGRSAAKTGNKPGVTKGKQWIRLKGNVELLDTPGILWPKFEDPLVGLHLAMIGSINDQILNRDELALHLCEELQKAYPRAILSRYNTKEDLSPTELLPAIALERNLLKKEGEPDYNRAAILLLDEFRSGILGPMTLEGPASLGE